MFKGKCKKEHVILESCRHPNVKFIFHDYGPLSLNQYNMWVWFSWKEKFKQNMTQSEDKLEKKKKASKLKEPVNWSTFEM